jgi:streptogramin lyase
MPTILAPAPEGKVWYSAHWNGALGILNQYHTREVKLGPVWKPPANWGNANFNTATF